MLCVSLNPSIDRRIRVSRLNVGRVNRASSAEPTAGGKAAHVAFAAHALGAEVRWLGFLGGPEGARCRTGLEARGIVSICVPISDSTRTNLEIIDDSNDEVTEILEPGPVISESELAAFVQEFERELANCPVVIASGSLPRGIPVSVYADLIQRAKRAGCPILLDTSGEALASAINAEPTLIKPNRQETEALVGREIETVNELVEVARELKDRGPKTVIISMGAEGAIAVGDHLLCATPPQLTPISTVGSGDSFLAGWAVGEIKGLSPEEQLRLAIACGAANCLARQPRHDFGGNSRTTLLPGNDPIPAFLSALFRGTKFEFRLTANYERDINRSR